MAEEFRPVVGNRKDREWDHLREKPEQGGQGCLIRTVVIYEGRQRKHKVAKTAERYDREGNERDDIIGAECIYDESGKE
jgi:hypothetical protein